IRWGHAYCYAAVGLGCTGADMPLTRRRLMQLAAGAAIVPVGPPAARAQVYPSRPVRIIIGLPPGGVNDSVGRLIGQWLPDRLDQPFVIENRPGASGNIAGSAVAKASPDGYTLMLIGSQNPVNAALFQQRTDFDLLHDIAPVAGVTRQPNVM